MKIDLAVWVRALRTEFNHSGFVEEVVVFFNTHLPCTNCNEIKRDDAFHKGSSPARRNRYPVCKACTRHTKNKNKNPHEKLEAEDKEYLEEAFEE